MGSSKYPTHGVYRGAVLDVDRHAGNEAPVAEIPKPELGKIFELNNAVANGMGSDLRDIQPEPFLTRFGLTCVLAMIALPVPGSKILATDEYGRSLWGLAGKVAVELLDGELKYYFFKASPRTDPWR